MQILIAVIVRLLSSVTVRSFVRLTWQAVTYGSEENNSENPDDRKWTADGTKQIKTGHEVCGSPWVPIL
ncbi:hypothetical protein T4C_8582 [Trichinella pseudospiralis]|uniref:Secreted protein n=1 Tax=Trichinella pseudospiralis TaxID=6337 RepID=A0A0V1IC99_TRIPS|nr:hypothetical protein T4C_8582 [Trichinella pseudospiralis]